MAADPYKPPAARVEDRIPDEIDGRPVQVTWACRILWVSLAVGLLALLGLDWGSEEYDDELTSVALAAAYAVFGAAVLGYAVLTYLTGRRNNFARWTLLCLLVTGWVLGVGEFSDSFDESPLAAAANLLAMGGELWASYLLFLSPGAAWFSRPAGPR